MPFQLTNSNLFPSQMNANSIRKNQSDQNMAMTVNDGSGYEWTELNMTLMNIFLPL